MGLSFSNPQVGVVSVALDGVIVSEFPTNSRGVINDTSSGKVTITSLGDKVIPLMSFTFEDVDVPPSLDNEALVANLRAIFFFVETLEAPFDLQGAINCSTNPNYPAAASSGMCWLVSVAGRIGGALGTQVEANDLIVALAANAGGTQAAVGTSWFVLQANVRAATQAEANAGISSTTYLAPNLMSALFVNRSLTKSIQLPFSGDGVTTSFNIPHGLNTRYVTVELVENFGNFRVVPASATVEIRITNTSSVDIVFTVPPAVGENYFVHITGKVV